MSTETCGCCDGVDASTPKAVDNRMGLSAIAYRIGEYVDFRDSMLAGLSSTEFAALDALRTRDADDYTIGLIDAVACAADVLTFYQERVANESYLRTATERVSLQEMAKLIGYRLRPGVAAETQLAFALEPPKTPPPALPADPGAFVTGIPTSVTLAAGLKVQSVPGPDEKPQTFETVEEIVARPEWNAIRPWLSEVRAPGRDAKETFLDGVGHNLKAGDAIVFVGQEFKDHPTTNNNWDFRLIDSVTTDPDRNRTRVRWKRGLGSVSPFSNPPVAPEVHVLRRRVGAFGHNAPMWLSMNRQLRIDYPGGGLAALITEWPNFTIGPDASANGGHVDLDSVISEIKPGGFVVLAKGEFNRPDENYPSGTYVELYIVTSTTEVSRAQFALSGKVTRLGVTGQNLAAQFFAAAVPPIPRVTSIYAQSEPLPLTAYPVSDAIGGDHVPVAIAPGGLEAGRRLIVTGTQLNGAKLIHRATLVSAVANTNGAVLTIKPPLPATLTRESTIVYANVALATHGETVAQILGAGDSSRSFQRFELKRLPLTYRSASNETGADSELSVRVGDVEWTEQPTLFTATATERTYTLQTDEQDKLWVTFGDGVRGARLPSGQNNVRATYRTGLGKDGNVRAETLTQLMTRPLGLKSVANPVAATGGTDPEPADQARRTMPLGTRTLGRAVSLLDYEDFALAFTGIAKADARVLQLATGPAIVITVAGQDGAPVNDGDPIRDSLTKALRDSGDPHVHVVLLSYQASTFRLGLKVKRDPAYRIADVLAAVEAALREHYSFDARSLAQPVLQSDVIAVAHSVPGVVAIDLDFLYGGTAPSSQVPTSRQTRLLASRARVVNRVALPAELLTLALGPLDRLEEMT
jgi:baseplate J-like protein